MKATAIVPVLLVSSVALSSCSTVIPQQPATARPLTATNLDGTGKRLSPSTMQAIVSSAAGTSSTETDWCTLDPLPNPLPANFMETVPTPYPLPNSPATSGFNQIWLTGSAPKRTWCFVKNEPEFAFTQCTTDPRRRCVDGDYFVINPKVTTDYTWINFTNQHSDKVRLVRLVWEP